MKAPLLLPSSLRRLLHFGLPLLALQATACFEDDKGGGKGGGKGTGGSTHGGMTGGASSGGASSSGGTASGGTSTGGTASGGTGGHATGGAACEDTCTQDADCDDGFYCNGAETCDPASERANAFGCIRPEAPICESGLFCDEAGDTCRACIASDDDGDGVSECEGDCDDAQASVNPEAEEVCNEGRDDDCNGLADANDGRCVACPAGYSGFDADCVNINECEGSPCGVGTCTDTEGSYTCECPSGYVSSGPGGTCVDINECETVDLFELCNWPVVSCENVAGSFQCGCADGFSAAPGEMCTNINECDENPCGAGVSECTDYEGGFSCSCLSGYANAAPSTLCTDIDECESNACGPGATLCENSSGAYSCTCASGYALNSAGTYCENIDDCAGSPCGSGANSCTDGVNSYTCSCKTNYVFKTGTCLYNNPALLGIGLTSGAEISPSFNPSTTSYTIGVPRDALAVSITPTLPVPDGATMTWNGTEIASGSAQVIELPADSFAPMVIEILVTADAGATRTTRLVVGRSANRIKAANTGASDRFGGFLALSGDGSTLAVAATTEQSSEGGVNPAGAGAGNSLTNAGAVYVFRKTGGVWAQEAFIKHPFPSIYDEFAWALSLSYDGNMLAIGHQKDDSGESGINPPGQGAGFAAEDSGAVILLERSGTTWTQTHFIKSPLVSTAGSFGSGVALSADGEWMLVGEPGHKLMISGVDPVITGSEATEHYVGAAHLYHRVAGAFTYHTLIKSPAHDKEDLFGFTVSLSDDGERLAVGAMWEDSAGTGVNSGMEADDSLTSSGATYVYHRNGDTVSLAAYLKAPNAGEGDEFGRPVVFSPDGMTLAVGSLYEKSSTPGVNPVGDDDTISIAGAVYVFEFDGADWEFTHRIKSPSPRGEWFGYGIAFSEEADSLVITAPYDNRYVSGIFLPDENITTTYYNAGAAYAYRKGPDGYEAEAYIKGPKQGGLLFGTGAALSYDGTTFVTGALGENKNGPGVDNPNTSPFLTDSGAVFVYDAP